VNEYTRDGLAPPACVDYHNSCHNDTVEIGSYIREGKIGHMVLWKILQIQIATNLVPVLVHLLNIIVQNNQFLVQGFFFSTMFQLIKTLHFLFRTSAFHYWKAKPNFQYNLQAALHLLHYLVDWLQLLFYKAAESNAILLVNSFNQ
jgi:hypothetical protein